MAAKNLAIGELYQEFHLFILEHSLAFLNKLQHLKGEIQIIKAFKLLNSPTFCHSLTCYSHPIFSVQPNNNIHLTVQQSVLSLAPSIYVRCTLLPNSRTSIYSHELSLLQNGSLHFKNNLLPSIKPENLLNSNMVDIRTKPVSPSDLIFNTLYPIFSLNKVSYQCNTPIPNSLDNQPFYCNLYPSHR